MLYLNLFRRTPRKALTGFCGPLVVAGTAAFALLALPPEGTEHDSRGQLWQFAQEKGAGKGKGKGAGGGGSAQKQRQNTAGETSADDEESSGGKHCPPGQGLPPLRGRGGSASVRGAGCM